MASRQDRPGIIAAVLEFSNLMFERLFTGLFFGIGLIVLWATSLLACLFAAEVAVGRRITRRDPEPERHREDTATRRAEFLGHPAPLNTAAGRGVEIFGHFSGPCPDTGSHPGHRTRKRGFGWSRCIYSPSCKNRRKPSRISNVSAQDWLKLNQPFNSQLPQRRPRAS